MDQDLHKWKNLFGFRDTWTLDWKRWARSEMVLKPHGTFGPSHVSQLTGCLQISAHFAAARFFQIVAKTDKCINFFRPLRSDLFAGFKGLLCDAGKITQHVPSFLPGHLEFVGLLSWIRLFLSLVQCQHPHFE